MSVSKFVVVDDLQNVLAEGEDREGAIARAVKDEGMHNIQEGTVGLYVLLGTLACSITVEDVQDVKPEANKLPVIPLTRYKPRTTNTWQGHVQKIPAGKAHVMLKGTNKNVPLCKQRMDQHPTETIQSDKLFPEQVCKRCMGKHSEFKTAAGSSFIYRV